MLGSAVVCKCSQTVHEYEEREKKIKKLNDQVLMSICVFLVGDFHTNKRPYCRIVINCVQVSNCSS